VASVPLPGAATRFDYESLDANTGRLFIAHLAASEVVVYDVNANRVDARNRRIYVNVQTLRQLVAIDPVKDVVVGRYPVPGCTGNHGLQLDDDHRRAYIACEGNAMLVEFDLNKLKALRPYSIGDDPDVLAYDRKQAILYVAAESGIVSMFAAHGAGLTKTGQGFLADNAHIVAVDQRTHLVYFPVLASSGPEMIVMRPVK